MTLKSDIINSAYSMLEISGITLIPSPEEMQTALERLESMAAEFEGRNIKTGYNFETNPDLASEHTMERKYWTAYETNLAIRLLSDYGKEISPILLAQAQGGLSFLSSATAVVNQMRYPSRQPVGRGNRRYRYPDSYYSQPETAPNEGRTVYMYVGDINDFKEDFSSVLIDSETVDSYTIEADSGLSIIIDSLSTPVISYQVSAIGGGDNDAYQRVKIVATTSDGRVFTRVRNFKLTDIEID